MKIEEEQLENKVFVAKTTRNKCISKTIKEPCVNICHSAFIIGQPNSGKSNLLNSMLLDKNQYRQCFDEIHLICPESSRDCFGEKSALTLVHKDRTHDLLDEDTIAKVYRECKSLKEAGDEEGKNRYSLIVIDDCMSELRNKYTLYWLKRIMANHRHLHTTIWITSQSYLGIPKAVREIVRCVYHFKIHSLKELERVHWEILPQYKNKELEELLQYIFDEKYNFFMIDKYENMITKNFNRLKITNSSEDIYQTD